MWRGRSMLRGREAQGEACGESDGVGGAAAARRSGVGAKWRWRSE